MSWPPRASPWYSAFWFTLPGRLCATCILIHAPAKPGLENFLLVLLYSIASVSFCPFFPSRHHRTPSFLVCYLCVDRPAPPSFPTSPLLCQAQYSLPFW